MDTFNIVSWIPIALLVVVIVYNALVIAGKLWVPFRNRHYYRRQKPVLLRLRVPKEDEKAPTKGPIVAEQIFNTLAGTYKSIGWFSRYILGKPQPKLSFEIAHVDEQIFFYVWIPKEYQRLMEGQIYAQYPEVEIEVVEDHVTSALEVRRPMVPGPSSQELVGAGQVAELGEFESVSPGVVCVAEMGVTDELIWPFKTYDYFVDKDDKTQVDTLSALTSAMSKLNHEADQAWFQMVIRPEDPLWQKHAAFAYKILKAGYFHRWDWASNWFVWWYVTPSFFRHWFVKVPITFLLKLLWRSVGLYEPLEGGSLVEKQEAGFSFWELPRRKLVKLVFQSSIRVAYLSRSGDIPGARLKTQEMASSFNQFRWPEVNGPEIDLFEDTSSRAGRRLYQRMKEREVDDHLVLAVDELATLFHLPMWSLETPNIAWVRSKKLEPPAELPTPKEFNDLTILGSTNFRGTKKVFGIKPDDRRRHMYIIGKTGMGKSTVLENMIHDDIQKGRGVAVVDPHGELADKVTAMIPKSRINDVVIFDPSDRDYPVSFNMLEVKNPEHRSLVASGLVGVFKKMYAESWGPRLEYILRNCILALTEFEGATLLGIPRLLVDPMYREKVLERVTDPVVKSFWMDEFAHMTDKLRVEAISPIQNKVGQFLSSSLIRNILGQVKSSIDIRFAMDTKKIFIANLSKGKIGEDNSSLLGAMLITKFQLDAMSRADMEADEREDFYLYVDEFQNFATDSFATILSEARKYKLNLVMANQYVEQMEEEVMHAVFGNVGTLLSFQVGFDDAEYFSKQFGEVVLPEDVIALPKYTTYIRLLVDNMPTPVFSAQMNPPVEVDMHSDIRASVIKSSRERYGAGRVEVEEKIMRWSTSLAAPEMKKALAAKAGGTSSAGVRWRYDRNKKEFEELIHSSGKKFVEIPREQFDQFGVKDAVNEFVYHIPEDDLMVYSRIDSQGKCFSRKENNIEVWKVNDGKPEKLSEVEKAPGWQLGLNKVLGGGFRSPKNQDEMESTFSKAGYTFEKVDRKKFDQYGLEKSLNEIVYFLKKAERELVVISALDPQGGCFTRNPDQVIQVGGAKAGKFVAEKTVKKSIEWMGELEEKLKV
ncbi:MAG: type IV secretion system DNA-binding domain-containing protein [bacterium]|nr:type IV secretion system DNA-binding domain-containing protein [bacterium]